MCGGVWRERTSRGASPPDPPFLRFGRIPRRDGVTSWTGDVSCLARQRDGAESPRKRVVMVWRRALVGEP
eukprot:1053880-Prymnesium_polylepis.1